MPDVKYAPLRTHLNTTNGDVWEAGFAEIERVLGFALPASARRYAAWWANSPEGGHSHARAWLDAGWHTANLQLGNQRVTFARVGSSADASRRPSQQGPDSPGGPGPVGEAPVVAFVACAKTKSAHPAKAKDLYISALFRKSRAFVERWGWRCYILSALHGLVDPESVLEPYERSLASADRATRRDWAANMLPALDTALPDGARVVLLAGKRYGEFLVPEFAARGHRVDQPLEGLRLGERLRFLADSRNLPVAPPSPVVPEAPSGLKRRAGQPRPDPNTEVGAPSPSKIRADGLVANIERARALATRLHRAFLPSGGGIFGEHEMPEDNLLAELAAGSREHLLFLTFTVSLDYMRDAASLWRAARHAWIDAGTRYLFEPDSLLAAGYEQAERDLKACGLSRRPRRDGQTWFTIARTLAEKWRGDPRRFLDDCGCHAPSVLRRLDEDNHLEGEGPQPDFPFLKGPKIASLWIRMLRDNAGIEFSGLDEVPIPVDVHVLRATLCAGALHGRFAGSASEIFQKVRGVWRDATRGLRLPDGHAMVALDVDEALWTLSRRGCSKRGNGALGPCLGGCPAEPGCVGGSVLIHGERCEVDTTPGGGSPRRVPSHRRPPAR